MVDNRNRASKIRNLPFTNNPETIEEENSQISLT